MFNSRSLTIATIIGTVLQLAMVIAGHSNPAIKEMFAVIGMAISLVAGVIYAKLAGAGSAGSYAIGGLLAGGICALIGIAVSCFLGDVLPLILVVGTLGSAVTGALGGWGGRFLFGGSRAAA